MSSMEVDLPSPSVSNPQIGSSTRHVGWAWYTLIVFEILALATGIDMAIVTLLVHPIEVAFRINDVAFAAITAIPLAIGIAVAYYPAGLLADTFRRRDIVVAGAVLWALGALLAAHADSKTMVFLARLLAGIGTGVSGPPIFSILSDAFPRTRRALAISVYSAGLAIGAGVGFTICGALVAATQQNGMIHVSGVVLSPWQQCFVAVAMMGVIASLLTCTVPEPPRMDRATHTSENLSSTLRIFRQYVLRHWLLWTLVLAGYSIGVTTCYAIIAWGPAFGLRHYGSAGVSSMALLGAFSAAGALLGSIGGGLIAQRGINHGNPRILPRMLVGASIISCAFVVSFPSMPSWLFAVAGIAGVNAAGTAVWFLIQIGIQETAPNEVRGQLMGLFGFIVFIPSSLGAMLVAFLASGVFAKAGGLGPALTVVGFATSMVAMVSYAFSVGPYERARQEMRALDASP